MGAYINPPGETKEAWLARNARAIASYTAPLNDGELAVCLVTLPGFGSVPATRLLTWKELGQISDVAFVARLYLCDRDSNGVTLHRGMAVNVAAKLARVVPAGLAAL